MPEQTVEINMLYDFYGGLLPERQSEFLRLYREENWSLAEIAEEFGLTRQGVYAGIKKAESALKEYESKLGLLERFAQTEQVLARIDAALAELGEQYRGDRTIQTQIASIRKTAHRLGE